jgi:hypothetical protein
MSMTLIYRAAGAVMIGPHPARFSDWRLRPCYLPRTHTGRHPRVALKPGRWV